MIGTQPLEKDQRRAIVAYFDRRGDLRSKTLFLLGCSTGFRVSEICAIRIVDVLDERGRIRPRLTVSRKSMKGKKQSRTVLLNSLSRKMLRPWLDFLRSQGYVHKADPLFPSRRGTAVTRFQVYKDLKAAYRACGIPGKCGTHSMRKTFANLFYESKLREVAAGKPVDAFRETSKALGHAVTSSTDKYLSFRQEGVDEAIEEIGDELL